MNPFNNSLCKVFLGVSSVGKSFLINQLLTNGTFLPGTKIYLGHDLLKNIEAVPGPGSIIHFNALRPFNNSADEYPADITADPAANALFDGNRELAVYVLVAHRSTIVKRILLRDDFEPVFRPGIAPYPSGQLFEFISRVSLYEVYKQWIDFLEARNIACTFVSTDHEGTYEIISSEEAFAMLNSDESCAYSHDERKQALKHFNFRYQGLEGKRKKTWDVIKPYLSGLSALDIGCAEGYFCFQLEKHGFIDVIGAELKRERFLAACALRDVNGSRCKFRFGDILQTPIPEKYDVILLLNVLHHLRNPIGALEMIANSCRKILILEYPTPEDPKFRATFQATGTLRGNVSVIGVSSLKHQDQTFLFSDEAMRRIIMDHSSYFKQIEFLTSPMDKSRSIAICKV